MKQNDSRPGILALVCSLLAATVAGIWLSDLPWPPVWAALGWVLLRRVPYRSTDWPRLAETGLGIWIVLAWTGGPPAVPSIWGPCLGLFTAIAAFAGCRYPATRASTTIRSIAIALAVAANYLAVEAAHDFLISSVLIDLWGNLAAWLVALVLAGIAIAVFLVLSLSLLWRRRFLNAQARSLIIKWNERDPFWSEFLRSRHRWHIFRARIAVRLLFRVSRFVCELLLGAVPPWIAPHVKPDRIELYLRALWAGAEQSVATETPFWRAALMKGLREERELAIALDRLGAAILVLGDYLLCPFPECPSRQELPIEDCRKMAFAIDSHLFDRMVFSSLSGKPLPPSTRLVERMRDYYTDLGRKNPGFQRVITFRIELLKSPALDDLGRFRLRNEVLEWLESNPERGGFVFDGLLCAFRAARDHASLIEACRRFEARGRELSPAALLDLGEAWFWYALETDPSANSPLAVWALHEAASRFHECGAAVHLDAMSTAFRSGGPAHAA